jgi:hypothetical protein
MIVNDKLDLSELSCSKTLRPSTMDLRMAPKPADADADPEQPRGTRSSPVSYCFEVRRLRYLRGCIQAMYRHMLLEVKIISVLASL